MHSAKPIYQPFCKRLLAHLSQISYRLCSSPMPLATTQMAYRSPTMTMLPQPSSQIFSVSVLRHYGQTRAWCRVPSQRGIISSTPHSQHTKLWRLGRISLIRDRTSLPNISRRTSQCIDAEQAQRHHTLECLCDSLRVCFSKDDELGVGDFRKGPSRRARVKCAWHIRRQHSWYAGCL